MMMISLYADTTDTPPSSRTVFKRNLPKITKIQMIWASFQNSSDPNPIKHL